MDSHEQKVKTSFTRQASLFSSPALTLSNRDYLKWIIDHLPLNASMRVLDLACGTGILTRALAPFVDSITGIDVTGAMLKEARRITGNEGLRNVEFHECQAEATRFPAQSFDVAITRFSVHHFKAPILQIREMARVTKVGGYIAIIDMVAPADPLLAVRYNEYERLRDPSHSVALSSKQIEQLSTATDLSIEFTETIEVQVNVARWLDLTRPAEDVAARIVADLEAEMEGGSALTGLFPSRDGAGELVFQQRWMMIVGKRL